MKKLLLFAAFLSLFAIPVLAQLPPPPLAPDYNPKGWKEYSFENDNVRFIFPAEPKVTETTTGTDDTKKLTRTYERASFLSLGLTVTEFLSGQDMEAKSKEMDLIQKMHDAGIERLKDRDPKIIKDSDITVDGHPGRFFQVETNDGFVTRVKFFLVKNRAYFAFVGVKKGERHGINDENDFEIPAMAFLDSVRMIKN